MGRLVVFSWRQSRRRLWSTRQAVRLVTFCPRATCKTGTSSAPSKLVRTCRAGGLPSTLTVEKGLAREGHRVCSLSTSPRPEVPEGQSTFPTAGPSLPPSTLVVGPTSMFQGQEPLGEVDATSWFTLGDSNSVWGRLSELSFQKPSQAVRRSTRLLS